MMPPIRFLDPEVLWLLAGPAGLAILWGWQAARRRREAVRIRAGAPAGPGSGRRRQPGAGDARRPPVPAAWRGPRLPGAGGLVFWLAVVAASALAILAIARPQALAAVTEAAGVDVVVLQDGSTSMRVADVAPDRWQRSVAWIRTFANVIGWQRERMALALFAHRAAPQVRLTTDPNALLFFLDHLGDEPPFRLRDDTSWSTNIEGALAWGVKMIDRDEALYGRRPGGRAFIVLSDGQAWTGEAARALRTARARDVRVYVIGVGTTAGGFIPQPPPRRYQAPEPPLHSVLDRQSLRAIAQAGGGAYFELGAERDEVVALRILADLRRGAAGAVERRETWTDLYWPLLAAAAAVLGAGALAIRDRAALWALLAVAAGLAAALSPAAGLP